MSNYLVLTRAGPPPQNSVLVNMDHVKRIEPTQPTTLYFGDAESPIYVAQSLDKIAAMLGAERA